MPLIQLNLTFNKTASNKVINEALDINNKVQKKKWPSWGSDISVKMQKKKALDSVK